MIAGSLSDYWKLTSMKRSTGERKAVRKLFAKLIGSEVSRFPKRGQRLAAPTRRGVYVIYDARGRVVHVGRTPTARGGIAQRLKDHMATASSFTRQYRPLRGDGSKLRGKYAFRCVVVESRRLRALLEAYATGQFCPDHIGLG